MAQEKAPLAQDKAPKQKKARKKKTPKKIKEKRALAESSAPPARVVKKLADYLNN